MFKGGCMTLEVKGTGHEILTLSYWYAILGTYWFDTVVRFCNLILKRPGCRKRNLKIVEFLDVRNSTYGFSHLITNEGKFFKIGQNSRMQCRSVNWCAICIFLFFNDTSRNLTILFFTTSFKIGPQCLINICLIFHMR